MKSNESQQAPPPKPHYHGHRQRLRERMLSAGSDALQDYELLELLLFSAFPRRDVKPLAKQLLSEFKSLWSLVNAPPERLLQYGLSENAVEPVAYEAAQQDLSAENPIQLNLFV